MKQETSVPTAQEPGHSRDLLDSAIDASIDKIAKFDRNVDKIETQLAALKGQTAYGLAALGTLDNLERRVEAVEKHVRELKGQANELLQALDQQHEDTEALTTQVRELGKSPVGNPVTSILADDKINHPSHYGGDVPYEAIKVLSAWGWGEHFCLANSVKYMRRAGYKDPSEKLQDLKKARWYLDYLITDLEKSSE